jgi:hypothetical protein
MLRVQGLSPEVTTPKRITIPTRRIVRNKKIEESNQENKAIFTPFTDRCRHGRLSLPHLSPGVEL